MPLAFISLRVSLIKALMSWLFTEHLASQIPSHPSNHLCASLRAYSAASHDRKQTTAPTKISAQYIFALIIAPLCDTAMRRETL